MPWWLLRLQRRVDWRRRVNRRNRCVDRCNDEWRSNRSVDSSRSMQGQDAHLKVAGPSGSGEKFKMTFLLKLGPQSGRITMKVRFFFWMCLDWNSFQSQLTLKSSLQSYTVQLKCSEYNPPLFLKIFFMFTGVPKTASILLLKTLPTWSLRLFFLMQSCRDKNNLSSMITFFLLTTFVFLTLKWNFDELKDSHLLPWKSAIGQCNCHLRLHLTQPIRKSVFCGKKPWYFQFFRDENLFKHALAGLDEFLERIDDRQF